MTSNCFCCCSPVCNPAPPRRAGLAHGSRRNLPEPQVPWPESLPASGQPAGLAIRVGASVKLYFFGQPNPRHQLAARHAAPPACRPPATGRTAAAIGTAAVRRAARRPARPVLPPRRRLARPWPQNAAIKQSCRRQQPKKGHRLQPRRLRPQTIRLQWCRHNQRQDAALLPASPALVRTAAALIHRPQTRHRHLRRQLPLPIRRRPQRCCRCCRLPSRSSSCGRHWQWIRRPIWSLRRSVIPCGKQRALRRLCQRRQRSSAPRRREQHLQPRKPRRYSRSATRSLASCLQVSAALQQQCHQQCQSIPTAAPHLCKQLWRRPAPSSSQRRRTSLQQRTQRRLSRRKPCRCHRFSQSTRGRRQGLRSCPLSSGSSSSSWFCWRRRHPRRCLRWPPSRCSTCGRCSTTAWATCGTACRPRRSERARSGKPPALLAGSAQSVQAPPVAQLNRRALPSCHRLESELAAVEREQLAQAAAFAEAGLAAERDARLAAEQELALLAAEMEVRCWGC